MLTVAPPSRIFSKCWNALFQFAKPGAGRLTPCRHKKRSALRLWLEALEARDMLATFRVMPMFTSAPEGGPASVYVHRDESNGAASVDFQTAAGSATAADYVPISTRVNFADGVLGISTDVTISRDFLTESTESFRVTISNPSSGWSIDPEFASDTVTISDQDKAPVANDDSYNIVHDRAVVHSTVGNAAITLDGHGKSLESVRGLAANELSVPSGASFPYGLFAFNVTGLTPGASATVEMVLPQGPSVDSYYKQDPSTGELHPFDFDGQTGAGLMKTLGDFSVLGLSVSAIFVAL